MDKLYKEQIYLIKYLNVLRAIENIEKAIDYLQVKVIEKCGDTDLLTFELDEYWKENVDIFVPGRWYTYIVGETELEVDEENNKTTLCITALYNH